ncbi:MAG TPA: flagellar brake protein, partial [Caldimonas sp.]|nr:flagellar brake protein [Caldimonas sp.]
METRPAPLDGMNDNEGLDEFRVTSPREIQGLLKQLLDGSVLLNLNASDGSVVTSAIWTLDSSRGTVGFNADPNDPGIQSLLECEEAMVVGYLDSVKLQFEVHDLVLVHGHRASVLSCPAPREMYRFQRRNAFRVRPLMRSAPVARLRHPDMPEMEFAL